VTIHVDPYKTSHELGINDNERNCLISLARDLSNEIVPDFDMDTWCGCIYGKMKAKIGDFDREESSNLYGLFMGHSQYYGPGVSFSLNSVTQSQASGAIQNFLLGVDMRNA
jgi:hypothetical protein